MRDLKHLIAFENLLQETNNELVRQGKADGKRALGYTCYFMPEVLLDLPGCFAVRLRAPKCTSPDMATYYMSSRTCHYGRSLFERALEGGYNFLDADFGTETCTVTCRFQEHLGYMDVIQNPDFFVTFTDVPFKKNQNSIVHYEDQLQAHVLDPMHEKYGIVEEDFISAELEAVPAANARDLGFDRSMIGAYGHDDRVCAYAELAAILQLEAPEKTAVCIFADKEEIGSEGVSGMQGDYFEYVMASLCHAQGVGLRECLAHSFCLSADVTAAYDPNFADVYEKRNAAFLNYGIGLCKYTGARGKSGASDASAETVGYVRGIFDRAKVIWQIAELGKVDAGGGGTVAMYMANRNITTLDAGVPVLAMHAPFEVVSKLDCYETYKGMKAVYEAE